MSSNALPSSSNPKEKKRKRDSQLISNHLDIGNRSEDDVEASLTSISSKSDLKKAEKKRQKQEKKDAKNKKYNGYDTSMESEKDGKKKNKKDKKDKKSKKKKSSEPESPFELVTPTIKVPIPPILSDKPMEAVVELFDTLVLRYVPQLQGILLSHNHHEFLSTTAKLDSDSAFAVCHVRVRCLVWKPRVGMRVEGKISLSEPSQVSLILHNTFNASISASHLPRTKGKVENDLEDRNFNSKDDEWTFVYDSSDDRMDYEESVTGEDFANSSMVRHGNQKSLGYWKKTEDGEKLGGEDGKLSFTIISLTISDHQISLHGSLLSDPFSVPLPSSSSITEAFEVGGAPSFSIAAKRVEFGDPQIREIERITYDNPRGDETTDDEEEEEDDFNMNVHLGGIEKKKRDVVGSLESENEAESDGESKVEKKKRKEERKRRREEEKAEKSRKKAKK